MAHKIALVLLVGLLLASSPALAQLGAAVSNWTPASMTYTPHHAGMTTMADVTNPLPFVGFAPCRIVDTRGAAGTFGGPSLVAGATRNFPLQTGPCAGIPTQVKAYSLNITVTNTAGPGFITAWPQGAAMPVVSTLNYLAAQTIANAAIVPAGTGTGISVVAGVSGTDLIIDINGYFSPTPGTAGDVFNISNNSGGFAATFTNNSTTCGGTCGISVFAGSGTGVGTFSVNSYGLFSQMGANTNDLAGIFGEDATGATGENTGFFSAGIRGEGRNGVIGITNTGSGVGVIGVAVSPATLGVRCDGNFSASGAKAFVEPHPTDARLTIRYVALEGPEAGTYFRGSSRTVNRQAVIQVPESFRTVTDTEGLTVQLTPVGDLAQLAVMSQDLNQIVVRSSRDVAFHYQVNGVRHAFKDWQVVAETDDFRPLSAGQRIPGWLTEEAKARLIANGTYNSDGTVNMQTAERLGWVQAWRDQASADAAAAAAAYATARRPK